MTEKMARTVAGARGVIAGSCYVAQWCCQHNDQVQVVWTGTPASNWRRPEHAKRELIVAWAQSRPAHYVREFALVARVMEKVAAFRGPVRLRLYGWHEGDTSPYLAQLRNAGVEVELVGPLSYRRFIRSLGEVAVGLSPVCPETAFNRGKSFGKILAYLDAKVPVIASDEVDHSAFFDSRSGVVSNDEDVWVASILDLLENPQRREEMSNAAFEAFERTLTTKAAARQVDEFLRSVVRGS